ncbi:hypothetical protein D3C83_102160 [compost metagenome]
MGGGSGCLIAGFGSIFGLGFGFGAGGGGISTGGTGSVFGGVMRSTISGTALKSACREGS